MSIHQSILTQPINQTVVTIIAVIYVSVIYIILGIGITYSLDKYVFNTTRIEFNQESVENIPLTNLVFQICLTFSILMVIAYLIRNIVQLIPFPLDFLNIIDYHNIRDVYTGMMFIIILIAFSQTLSKQYKEIKFKLSNKIY